MPDRSWGQHCSGTMKTVVLSNGVKLPVRQELAELIGLLGEETLKSYALKPGWCWGYACRKIRGSNSWSNHAWGLAVDLNAPENPMGPRTGKIRKHPKVISMWKSYGFIWGGDWTGRADDMHFEFKGSVSDAKKHTDRAKQELGKPQQEKDMAIIADDGRTIFITDGIYKRTLAPGEAEKLTRDGLVTKNAGRVDYLDGIPEVKRGGKHE